MSCDVVGCALVLDGSTASGNVISFSPHFVGHVIIEGLHSLCQIIHTAITVGGGRPGPHPGLRWSVKW